jgi:hypothetical protein
MLSVMTKTAGQAPLFRKGGAEVVHRAEKMRDTKASYGPFGILNRTIPQTVENRVYKGYCLSCHDVYTLQQLLTDQTIPLDLMRYDPNSNSSIRFLQDMTAESQHDDGFTIPKRNRSPI